jgi:hypothetical protein
MGPECSRSARGVSMRDLTNVAEKQQLLVPEWGAGWPTDPGPRERAATVWEARAKGR